MTYRIYPIKTEYEPFLLGTETTFWGLPPEGSIEKVSMVRNQEVLFSDPFRGSKIGSKFYGTKPCYHVKWNSTFVPWKSYRFFSNRMVIQDHITEVLPPRQFPPVPNLPLWSPDVDDMAQIAYNKFVGDFSALTFIFEPIKVKRVSKKEILSGSLKYKRKIKFEYDDPRPNLSSGKDAILSTTLGTLPFVADLSAIKDRIQGWDKQLDRLNRLLQRGFRQTLFRRDRRKFDYLTGVNDIYRIRGTVKTKRVYGLRYTASVPNVLRGLISRFNFQFNLATAWEFVPFSFLVDYLFPIGTALDNGLVFSDMLIRDAWRSEKSDWVIEVLQNTAVPLPGTNFAGKYSGSFGSEWKTVQFIRATTYSREPGAFDRFDGLKVGSRWKVFRFPSVRRNMTLIGLASALKPKR